MFTGIVEQIGTIKRIEDATFTIGHDFPESLTLGESIALNGACMTVTHFTEAEFLVDITEESRLRTSFDQAQVGNSVNLERSAIIGQRNSGHNVAGHIDETGKIIALEQKSDFWLMRIQISPENRKFIIFKGSIAVEGISLTISNLSQDSEVAWFEVSIIPHTWTHTNLHQKQAGHLVNLEYDQFGKYVLNKSN